MALDRLPVEPLAWLQSAAALAERRGERLAWVGGGVRDLLLGRDGLDLDCVLEGELEAFARALADRLGARPTLHPRFLTATLALPGGARLDLVRARRERYAAPAALPEVAPATLGEDLARRDFAINALAIGLSPAVERGALIDPLGGAQDLAAGWLRALHPRSFLDDPTRMVRGLRFALRFGFRFESTTRAWAEAAIAGGAVDRLSGTRLAHELRLLFDDRPEIEAAFAALADLELAPALSPALAEGGILARASALAAAARGAAARLAPRLRAGGWPLALAALAAAIGEPAASTLAARLELTRVERELAGAGPRRVERAGAALTPAARPHQAAEALAGLSDEELALVAAGPAPAAAAWVERWLEELRPLRLRIGARDLIARGVAPGPDLGRALRAARRARLDGEIGPDQELELALRQAARAGASR